jgi:hypothetical protein
LDHSKRRDHGGTTTWSSNQWSEGHEAGFPPKDDTVCSVDILFATTKQVIVLFTIPKHTKGSICPHKVLFVILQQLTSSICN